MLTIFSPTDLLAWARGLYGNQRLYITPFAYNVSFGDVAAAVNVSRTVQISAQADFVALGVSLFNDVSASADPFDATLFLTDSSSGKPFMSAPVFVGNYAQGSFGNENRAFSYPRLLQGNSAVGIQFQNNTAATTLSDVIVTLNGFQVRVLA